MRTSEIFRSIQGEGRNQGRPCTFLRLTGCNLSCRWCDTPYALEGGTEKSEGEIEREIASFGGRLLCITGGEPLLQGEGLLPLVARFKGMGYSIEIETNGTIDFSPFQPYASITMDVKCPSSGEKSDLSLLSRITPSDSVKFVVQDRTDCEYAAGVLKRFPIAGETFFSPVFGTDPCTAATFLLDCDLPARLQIQLHRILGVR